MYATDKLTPSLEGGFSEYGRLNLRDAASKPLPLLAKAWLIQFHFSFNALN
jgi:hypothetical protein